MKRADLYRKIALDRLTSPEQLDQVLEITSARSWVALVGAIVLAAAVVVWSVFGSIPTRVYGSGVLIRTGGIYDVVSPSTGVIGDVSVRTGDIVREGQVVARVEQPGLVEELRVARATLEDLRSRHTELERFGTEDEALSDELAERERGVLKRSFDAATEELRWLEAKALGQQRLLDEGLIRADELVATEQLRAAAAIRARSIEGEIRQVALRNLIRENDRQRQFVQSRQEIAHASRRVRHLEDRLRSASQVRSSHAGRILEVMSETGGLAQQGTPLFRLDRVGDDVQNLEAVIYIPGLSGKRVRRGMQVQLSPANVKREEHGYMIGTVVTVSEFPATQEAMTRVLKNQSLVHLLSGGAAPYEAFISLRLDAASADGYAWSSRSPGEAIQSGTLCSATITTHTRRPIELVAPFLRRAAGI